jgi:4-hydroxy 2-oxovalerate aldolase
LAAINGCHPNYASYLSNKQTLPVKSISTVLRMIEPEKRALFNKEVAEEKYRNFQERNIDDSMTIEILGRFISGKNVILMAPGESLLEYESKIFALKGEDKCVIIAVSFVPDFMSVDFVFLSNSKRYNTTFNPTNKPIKLIHTSNIQTYNSDNFYSVNYHSLLNEEDYISDNSAIMALNLLLKLNPAKVFLAGLDGYNPDKANYYAERLNLIQDRERTLAQNKAMKLKIGELSKKLNLEFVTPSMYK